MANHPSTEDRRSFTLEPATIITLLTMIAALIAARPHFNSARPATSPARIPASSKTPFYDWRIQDDPLAVLSGRDVLGTNCPLERTIGTTNDRHHILAVMLPGGSSSEDHEARIRARQAVVAGLIELGYGPQEPDRIGVWRLDREQPGDCKPAESGERIPFENYSLPHRGAANRPSHVCIA